MLHKIEKYFRLVKFSHTIFAMPFAFIGFTLGYKQLGTFELSTLLLIILCMIFARNSAMGFNRLVDRKYDAENPRTKNREIPQGEISVTQARIFIWINVIAFITTTYFLNNLCFYLSPIAIATVLVYSYMKRFSSLCHYVLSTGLALAPIGAYLAVTAHFNIIPVLFGVLVFFWVGGFDIIYSCQDAGFDSKYQLYSIPSLLGVKNALRVSKLSHLFVIGILMVIGYIWPYNQFIYAIAALIFTSLIIYQHSIVKHNDLSRVNIAFGTTNGFASFIFAVGIILAILC
ncbi:putative 4-hydroxybenzoate polyprenyltransferase [Halosquirtibacter laminarini]|uniref:4-hydroxybenzoate polyprenyltransferase n=1 Tax=Halosquirtibacter laminarini TaxID=3374600 RepID=A0AC61NGC6_9BACT|nr:putative 4-hydroxybenzoate polyprenyltransferase [Prolixibacteraceae bacterium]